MSKLTEKFEQN